MIQPRRLEPVPMPERQEAEQILAYHDGNAVEAIHTMIIERDELFRRLLISQLAMGWGFTRGWRP